MLVDELKEFFADVVLDIFANEWIKPYYIALAISFSCAGVGSMVVVSKSSIITTCLHATDTRAKKEIASAI